MGRYDDNTDRLCLSKKYLIRLEWIEVNRYLVENTI